MAAGWHAALVAGTIVLVALCVILEKKLQGELAAVVESVAQGEEKRSGLPVEAAPKSPVVSAEHALTSKERTKERTIERLADEVEQEGDGSEEEDEGVARQKKELGKQESKHMLERQRRLAEAMVKIQADIAATGAQNAKMAKHWLQWKQAKEEYEQAAFHDISGEEHNRTGVSDGAIEAFEEYAKDADLVSGVEGYKALLQASYDGDKNRTQVWKDLLEQYKKDRLESRGEGGGGEGEAGDKEPAAEAQKKQANLRGAQPQLHSAPKDVAHPALGGGGELVRAKEAFSFKGMLALKAGAQAVLLGGGVGEGVDKIRTVEGKVGLFPASDLAPVPHGGGVGGGDAGKVKLGQAEGNVRGGVRVFDAPGHGVISKALESARQEYLQDRARELARSAPSEKKTADLDSEGKNAVQRAIDAQGERFRAAKHAETEASYESTLHRSEKRAEALRMSDLREFGALVRVLRGARKDTGLVRQVRDALAQGKEAFETLMRSAAVKGYVEHAEAEEATGGDGGKEGGGQGSVSPEEGGEAAETRHKSAENDVLAGSAKAPVANTGAAEGAGDGGKEERQFRVDQEQERARLALADEEHEQQLRGEQEKMREQRQEQRDALQQADMMLHAHDASIPISKVTEGYQQEVSALEGAERRRDGMPALITTAGSAEHAKEGAAQAAGQGTGDRAGAAKARAP